MSNSPILKVNLKNNNVESTVPLNGVSVVLARTTKGPQNDPSTLISSLSQFSKVYGKEIVPDGSISNIEKALAGGSTLRIVRVQGSDATKGLVGTKDKDLFSIQVGSIKIGFGLQTKYKGDSIGSGSTYAFQAAINGSSVVYKVVDADGNTILDSGTMFTFKSKDDNNAAVFDYLALSNFFQSNPYFEPIITTPNGQITSIEGMIDWLGTVDGSNQTITVQFNSAELTTTYTSVNGTPGNQGTTPTLQDWKTAFESILDFNDMYQVIASHIHQHLPTDSIEFHSFVKTYADKLQEWIYYIECPKINDTKAKMIAWMNTTLAAVGHSMFIAYFGAGIKYYNNAGILKDCDVLGSVIGLGDASAINYGPYKSFAGMNRGTLPDALGPVSPNYGSPSRYDDINDLAHSYLNLIVVKDTKSSGKVAMLWHNFTSQVKQDSFRFISNVRLVLYMKKQFRPIIESYFEEPNIWGSWKRLYLEAKPIIDDLVTNEAITDPNWMGDQDATSWSDLQINNEADARQGKYHAQFKFKDVATMQEITLDLVIDQASKESSVSISN
jgi:hypothetical protein|nr:MAG TPA: tail connector protein [Caudoviricetes sp.]